MSQIDIRQGDEDAAESKLVGALNELLNGKSDAATAAKLVDQVITEECQKGAARYEAANAEDKDNVDKSAIGGWQKFLYDDLIARGAMLAPTDHAGQDQLVSLVQELNRLPRHTVPRVLPDGTVDQKELWNISRETNYDGFQQWLSEIIASGCKYRYLIAGFNGCFFRPFTDGAMTANPYGKEKDTKHYVNLSSFLARLLASGTAALLEASALLDPFAKRSLVTVASQKPETYAYQVAAAAQWILHSGEAIREMCQKRAMAGKRWTPELWESLKEKFDAVAKDERFTAEGCEWAAKARDRMVELEQQDLSGKEGVVEMFKFRGPAADED